MKMKKENYFSSAASIFHKKCRSNFQLSFNSFVTYRYKFTGFSCRSSVEILIFFEMIIKELLIIVLLINFINCITNKNDAIESQLSKPQNRKTDDLEIPNSTQISGHPSLVLIGHSDAGTIDRNLRTRKYYPNKNDIYYTKYSNLIDENSKEIEESEVEESSGNLTFFNPRSGYAFGAGAPGYGGLPATRPGYFGGNGYSFGHGYSSSGGLGLLGSGLGLGLGSLHLLDPLLLLATLSFILFLVNSVITLVERIRLGGPVVAARREFFARDSQENHPHFTQEIINDMEQFFHQIIEDYEAKISVNKTHKI
jgi:hypothetical protein